MDKIRRIGKFKSSTTKFEGNQRVHEEKSISKLATPSLVARLMGLDGLPSQQSTRSQQNHFVSNNIQLHSPMASQRDDQFFEDQSHKKSFVEKTQFKDVFEDTVDRSHPNKELADELFQQPDSLFVQHMHAAQGVPASSLCNHTAVSKPSESSKLESKAKGWKADREASVKCGSVSQPINEDHRLSHSYSSRSSRNSLKLSKFRVDGKDETNIVTTRIVVLKPNYAKTRSAHSSFSSPDSSNTNLLDSRNDKEYMKDESYLGKIDFSRDRDFSRSACREARETVKKATREMRETSGRMMSPREARDAAKKFNGGVQEVFDRMMTYYPSHVEKKPWTGGLRDFSGIDSASESVMLKMTSYDSTESFVSRKAKKRLLERWKLAQTYQDVGLGGKGSTLGEMLSIPESDITNLDVIMDVDGMRGRFNMQRETARRDGPLGISSRDGWKDKYSNFSQRSKSLPPPFTDRRGDKLYAERESRVDDKLLMPKEARSQGSSKAMAGNINKKEHFSSKNSRPRRKKSEAFHHTYTCDTISTPESYSTMNQMDVVNLEKKDPLEGQSVSRQTPSFISNVDAEANPRNELLNMSVGSSNEFPLELSTNTLKYSDSSAVDQENSNPQESPIGPHGRIFIVQCSGADHQSSESSKEADHPSPVSVLEVLSVEDDVSSSPECFEQVNADLRELRKQLQLLRRESETYIEAPILGESDNDVEQGLAEVVRSKCWKSSYIADVLIEMGFNNNDPDMFMTTMNSLDFPMGSCIFYNLEKKYCDEINAPKYERRLLFDCINLAFLEICRSCMDPFPWVRLETVSPKWQKFDVRDELLKFLAIQEKEKEAGDRLLGGRLDKEMHWLDSRDSVNVIGMEVEKLLIGDLINELVTM